MSKYFLHLSTGARGGLDEQRQEFSNLADAKREAVLAGRDILAERIRAGGSTVAIEFRIYDDAAACLAVMPMSAEARFS